MGAWCAAAWKRDEGEALIEYSLILALVAVGLVAVLLLFRQSLGNSYQQVGGDVDRAGLPVSSPGGSRFGAEDPADGAGGGVRSGYGYPEPGTKGRGGKGSRGHDACVGGGAENGGCGGGRDR
jgi:Flp pilus assembly pilin Flp